MQWHKMLMTGFFFFFKYAIARDATPFEKDTQARDATLFWRHAPSSAHKLTGWILTTVYISLKAVWQNWRWVAYRISAYMSVCTAWQQLGYKWWSQSILVGGQHWSWCSMLVVCSLLNNKIKCIRHCASTIQKHMANINDRDCWSYNHLCTA